MCISQRLLSRRTLCLAFATALVTVGAGRTEAADLPRPIRSAPQFLYDAVEDAKRIAVGDLKMKPVGVKADATVTPAGALKIHADFGSDGERQRIDLNLDQPVELGDLSQAIGFWIKAPPMTYVNWRFKDASGRTYVVPTFRQTRADWQFAAATPDDFREAFQDDEPVNQRGPKSNKVQLPVQWIGLSISGGKVNDLRVADIELKDVAVLKRRDIEATTITADLADAPFANVYAPGATAQATVSVPKGTIEWTMTRHDGAEIASGKGGTTAALSLPLKSPGHYVVMIRNLVDGRVADARELKLAAMPPTEMGNERFAICSHFERDYYHIDSADLLPILGINSVRFGIPWHRAELKPGVLKIPAPAAAYFDLARERGTRILLVVNGIGTARDIVVPKTPEEYEAFVKFATFVIDAGKGAIDRAEIWNEWSNATGMPAGFKPTPEGYVELMNGIIPGIRKHLEQTGQKVELVGLGGENPYRFAEEIDHMLKAGGGKHFDSLSYHPYTNPTGPERGARPQNEPLDAVMARLSRTAAEHGGPRKIQITEAGYSTHSLPWGLDEREDARQTVRYTAMAMASEGVDRSYLYTLHDEEEISITPRFKTTDDFPQHHFGVFHSRQKGYMPKETAIAYATLVRMSKGATQFKLDRPAPGVYRESLLAADGKAVRTMWWTDRELANVRLEGGGLKGHDLFGMPITGDRFPLTQEPIYIDGDGGRLAGAGPAAG